MPKDNCKLCLLPKKLVKSHIIPDFFYEGIFDEKHFMNKLRPYGFINSNEKIQRNPTGEYDKIILCGDCDKFLGKFETYAKLVFSGDKINESSPTKISKLRPFPIVTRRLPLENEQLSLHRNSSSLTRAPPCRSIFSVISIGGICDWSSSQRMPVVQVALPATGSAWSNITAN